ncbi:AAA family ATPase [bacterium]|jgi:chromosome partitioning protein|nr:AAA family ATPase [bacterium]
MRVIALMNQKGGVGKTTTTVNLAAALARESRRVCVIDLDPQAHSSAHLGIQEDPERETLYDSLVHSKPLTEVTVQGSGGVWVVPSDINLAAAEVELAGVVGREMLLRDLLEAESSPFDYVLMDCPPSLGVLTINALTAANEVFVPLQPHYLALHGMSKLFSTVELVSRRLNPPLVISGIILCMYETGTRLSAEILNDLEDYLDKGRTGGKKTPWSSADIFRTRIRRNIKVAEAASFGQPIFEYEPGCHGSRDYASLAREVMAQEAARLPRSQAA